MGGWGMRDGGDVVRVLYGSTITVIENSGVIKGGYKTICELMIQFAHEIILNFHR